jgi:hypothetical protein
MKSNDFARMRPGGHNFHKIGCNAMMTAMRTKKGGSGRFGSTSNRGRCSGPISPRLSPWGSSLGILALAALPRALLAQRPERPALATSPAT